jgi:hypothetical protein
MGETMRSVITHEIGHALGLPHNMIASASIPVDSLRSKNFAHTYGVSLTIMDYARQNYVAQPGDGLSPKDFVRHAGPFDDFVINWGYRVIPTAKTAEAEIPTLDKWITSEKGMFAYRYGPQQYTGIDPRNQTEDIGDDAVKASQYAMMNLKKVFPQLVAWTTKPDDDYEELDELYNEALSQWSQYMTHVTNVVGGVYVDFKKAGQAGAVYHIVPKEKQKTALAFLADNAFAAQAWLSPSDVIARIGQPDQSVSTRVGNIVTQLLAANRLGRISDAESLDPAAYKLGDYLDDLQKAVWTGAAPDAHRRTIQRVYLERLAALVNPPAPAAAAGAGGRGGGGGGGGAPQPPRPFAANPNLPRTDIAPLARAQLRSIQAQARTSAGTATSSVVKAHWADIADRVTAILEPRGR